MAWYYVKRSCGHEERFQITGNHSYREWMIARLEGELCSDCIAAQRAEENAAAAAANAESELPALVGSEKQIGWAATIRHNRARGVHGVAPMIDLVAQLVRLGWSDEEIAKELGMSADEVLRYKQHAGLPELFKGRSYSHAWIPGATDDDAIK